MEVEGLYRLPVPTKPRAIITAAAGDHIEYLPYVRSYFQAYADRTKADYIEVTGDMRPDWPMSIKWRMPSYGWHYDQVLMVDCDVFIKPDAPDIFEIDAAFAGVDEFPDYTDKEWYYKEAAEYLRSQGVQFKPFDRCMNAGVMLVERGSLDLYHEPKAKYPKYWCGEQYWLWHQLQGKDRVVYLDPRWNWGYLKHLRNAFWDGVADANFIHLNNLLNNKPLRTELLKKLTADYPLQKNFGYAATSI